LEKIRAFIAVPTSEEIRTLVGDLEGNLAGVGADVKWVKPHNVHITLKFLGNVTQADVDSLINTIPGVLEGVSAFDVQVSGTGTFPPGRWPRVVWVGLAEGKEHLAGLGARVEGACASLGFEKEKRPFRPHLTIGRVRRGSRALPDLAEQVGSITFNPLKLRVDEVNLVRSRLSPQGPTYTILESFALEHS
jgi:2'-5' RNA ligase